MFDARKCRRQFPDARPDPQRALRQLIDPQLPQRSPLPELRPNFFRRVRQARDAPAPR